MEEDPVDLKVEGGRFDLEGFVRNGTWREMLVELVDTKKLDPWDIDIVSIVDGYVDAVKQMKVLDLYIPANIILATSILLRMKSDSVAFFSDDSQLDMGLPVPEEFVRTVPDLSGLIYKSRIRPPRRISLQELMDALEDAMKIEKKHFDIKSEYLDIPIKINEVGVDQKVERVVNIASKHLDAYKSTTFSTLSREFPIEKLLTDLFIPLLFLANKGRVSLVQERFFDDIIVSFQEAG